MGTQNVAVLLSRKEDGWKHTTMKIWIGVGSFVETDAHQCIKISKNLLRTNFGTDF